MGGLTFRSYAICYGGVTFRSYAIRGKPTRLAPRPKPAP